MPSETQTPPILAVNGHTDLLAYCNSFIKASADWRLQNWEPKWHRWQRYADSVYDPELAALKRKDQSKAFVPLTPTHREGILATIYRTLWGANPPLEVRARVELPNDQSDNIRDLLLREADRTSLDIECNKIEDDSTTFGSGFGRVRFETLTEDRVVRKMMAQPAPIDPTNPQAVAQSMQGPQIPNAVVESIEPVVIYRGLKVEWLNIWDVFPDPSALEIDGSPIAYRYYVTQGELEQGAQDGYYLPEVVNLRDLPSEEPNTQDQQQIRVDREQTTTANITRNVMERKRRCYELEAKLPRRMVFGPDAPEPEKLIAAVVRFHQNAVIMVEPSDARDGQPSIFKIDHFHVNGQFYGRGVPEQLKDAQELSNETVNMRFDELAQNIRKKFAVIEAAVINVNDFTDPDAPIRLDGRKVKDVREALMLAPFSDVTKSAYVEVQEWERYAQSRTSFNDQRIGSKVPGTGSDQTLGEVEMLRQATGEKFAYLGMLRERGGYRKMWRKMWTILYKHIEPEDVLKALGPERSMKFELLSPEQIDQDYIYEPQGIFTMENKAQTQAGLAAIDQEFLNEPWLNRMAIFDRIVKSKNISPDTLKYSPQEMTTMMGANHLMAQVKAPVPPGAPASVAPPAQQ